MFIDDGKTCVGISKNKFMLYITTRGMNIKDLSEMDGASLSLKSLCCLFYGNNFIDKTSFPSGTTYNCNMLFCGNTVGNKKLFVRNAGNLILPATTLTNNCYSNMFTFDTSLVTAPELPATTLKDSCYSSMFQGCTSLVTAPALPATNLAFGCYQSMFYGCTSLFNAPALPATTLASGCYNGMFNGCTSLVNAPALPSTTLAVYCYQNMFQGCTSLVNAPVLSATTLKNSCYNSMFYNCSSLNYIKCLATDISASNCTNNWVDSVATSGTFVKAATMENWTTGSSSGIPLGWDVENAQ